MMLENIVTIEWDQPRIAVPAFITMAIMPLTYSIAYGVVAGLCVYLALHIVITAADVVHAAVTGALRAGRRPPLVLPLLLLLLPGRLLAAALQPAVLHGEAASALTMQ
jgi:xanthine/uracil/vitamin C permease (AzgA family)